MIFNIYIFIIAVAAIADLSSKIPRGYSTSFLAMDLFTYSGLGGTTYLFFTDYTPSRNESILIFTFVGVSLLFQCLTIKSELALLPHDDELSNKENFLIRAVSILFSFLLIVPLYYFAVRVAVK